VDASPVLNSYVLQSASKNKAAGYILNSRYNWQYLQAHGGALPPEQKDCSLSIPGMENGNYVIRLFSCTSGEKVGEINKATSSNILSIPLPPNQVGSIIHGNEDKLAPHFSGDNYTPCTYFPLTFFCQYLVLPL
jgi:hypothetical protein